MNDVFVSVIVPVYNIEEYIKPCVDSILSSCFENLEIILVDDGSNDDSPQICDEISKNNSLVKVIHKENGGLSSARNAGLDVARGQYVLFLDGDDRLCENAIDKLYELAKANGYPDIIQFKYAEVDKNGNPLYNYTYNNGLESVTEEREKYERLYSLGGIGASACTKLIKKDLFDNLQFKEGIIHEDEYIVTDLLSRSDSILYVDSAFYLYYFRDNSIITSNFSDKKLDVFYVSERRIKILLEKGYYDLVNKEYQKLYVLIPFLYPKAMAAGNKKAAEFMKKKFSVIPDEFSKTLSGSVKIKFFLIKKFRLTLDIIYFLKKILKRV